MSETKTPLFRWKLHGDGASINPGNIVLPGERLSWPRTIGIGAQHVVAMFGATFLVPLLTKFPPSTTLFFTAIGTLLFFLNGWTLRLPIGTDACAGLYLTTLAAGFVCLLMAGSWASRTPS